MKTYLLIAQGIFSEPFRSIIERIKYIKGDECEKCFLYIDPYGSKFLNSAEDIDVFYDFNGFDPSVDISVFIDASQKEKWDKYIADWDTAEDKDVWIADNNPYWEYDIEMI